MINQNWWFTTLLVKQHKYCPPLNKDIKCDVLIVGGGFSGISAAAEFLDKGLSVVLLEKNIVGGSSAGRSAGFLTPGKRGLVQIGPHFQSTEVPHIYGAGDVIGPPALAATGIEQAHVAVCHAFGETLKSDIAPLLPTGIYTIPEASCVGDTEAAMVEKNIPYVVGRAGYADIPRGNIIGDTAGFLKLLFHRDDQRLLGVHVMGEHATELVHIGLVAMLSNATAELFNRACFNYPTLGELYKYATYDALLQRGGLNRTRTNECTRLDSGRSELEGMNS